MSFRMQIDPRSRKAARVISGAHKQLQQAYLRASSRGVTQQNIAEALEVDRSTINRRLLGGGNLTLRSLADFAHALDEDVEIIFKPSNLRESQNNYRIGDTVIVASQPPSGSKMDAAATVSTTKKSIAVDEYA